MSREVAEFKRIRREEREGITLPPVTILSNTCLGGRLYHDYHSQFSSPTIDLYIPPESFVKLCCHLDYYLSLSFRLTDEPCAKGFFSTALGDVKVYFGHSNTDFKTAVYNWDKRKERIVWDNIRCICTDRVTIYTKLQNAGIDVIKNYGEILYRKVYFTVKKDLPQACLSYVVPLPSFSQQICCPVATQKSPIHLNKYVVETDGFNLDEFIM